VIGAIVMILSETQLGQILSFLKSRLTNLEAVYLFGSGAGSDFTTQSDLDLAVKTNSAIDEMLIWDIKNELANIAHREVDVIDLSSADSVIRMQVVSTGVRVFSANHEKSEAWDSMVYSMYLQLNDDRKEILEEISKTGRIYG